ncbi:hypothetical protein CEXT_180721 [Caerostris extrusa]|uniref:Uncharacterized protein n=1 Tax=Caerostris extrusa TaxID=172846 RepID=A0AAV4MEY8_CAEEX|nr:hypothetical protein CEXT_180721 [Caerostris extrusa]
MPPGCFGPTQISVRNLFLYGGGFSKLAGQQAKSPVLKYSSRLILRGWNGMGVDIRFACETAPADALEWPNIAAFCMKGCRLNRIRKSKLTRMITTLNKRDAA